MGLKEEILARMTHSEYRGYYESELDELSKMDCSGNTKTPCCFHTGDTEPSLSVNLFNGLFHCFGCHKEGSIFDFHMERHGVDFKTSLEYFANFLGIDPSVIPKKTVKKTATKKKKPLGKPSVVYQYKNLDGKVIFETCRYNNPKDFRQRRPHPTKKNEFLWNLKDVEIIPYHLAAVAKSDLVFVVEGEKDANRLGQIGLTATCNPMGAGKFPDSLVPYFKDKTVIILNDNDEPGRIHGDLVAGKLKGTAKSIQVVNLPNLAPGGDVSDWLTAGNTKADLLEVIKNQKPYEDHIDFLNKNHAVVMHAGKCLILNEEIDPIFNRHTVNFSRIEDFKMRYANRLIPNPNAGTKGQSKTINIVTDWIKSPDRRQYEKIIFSPGRNIKGCYNLWRDFKFKPKKGDWALFKDHIFNNIACGKQHINDWLLTWMARIVQDPGGKRPKTAIVLRGDHGVGKGVFLSNFGEIFGNHFLQINNQQYLTSRFNGHLQDVIFLFVDEGFWAGDKASEGVIKGMVTEDIITIESKGKDAITLHNHINIALASNNEWVVPAGLMERRFMVLDVSNIKQQDHPYFGAIDKQLNSGGYEAMVYDLLEYDTSLVDVSQVLKTSAGFDQQVQSMTPVQKFWYEKLRSGRLQGQDFDWGELIQTEVLYAQYKDFCDDIGVRHRVIDKQFGKEIRKFCPEIDRKLVQIMSNDAQNYIKKWHYTFPSLERCRNLFENALKIELDWDTDAVFVDGHFDGI